MSNETAAVDFNVPPLANAGTGVVPTEVQEFAAAVERAGEAAKAAEPYREACERLLGVAKRVVLSDGREGVVFANEDLPPLLVALAEAAGKRDEPIPSPNPAQP